ncbi:sensor histidine kinase [Algihabitans albus]|uniref:sensor histidine kinase n=1 Tax=Algihabitans albus TaxID=2164067 RepID=UPI001F37F086|nr:PAS-domain containing protein [Algihabitans albus]
MVLACLAGIMLWRARKEAATNAAAETAAQRALRQVQADLLKAQAQADSVAAERDEESRLRETAEAARDNLYALMNGLPRPVWWRGSDLSLLYANDAYLAAVGLGRGQALATNAELVDADDREAAHALARAALGSGESRSQAFHVVAGGRRVLLEITETPLADGTLVGHARDLTAVEELRAELARHDRAQSDVLENINVGIAVLGPDMHLTFYNQAYARLWQLGEAFLAGQPHIAEVWDRLRAARRLPEQADFGEFKSQQLRSFQRVIEPVEELMHLPDGTTLRFVINPHPFGGVLLTYEDVTDTLRLERTYNTLLEVQRETLDNLFEGVAVYGADGRLKLYNPAFAQTWNLPGELLDNRPHVREIVQRTRDFYDVDDDIWSKLAEEMVVASTEPREASGRLERADGTQLDWTQVMLPDGASLFTYVDVTDSTRVERALRERNEALETTDRLKSEFIANISYELRTPLNAIIGFAEILENQYFGPLSERQREYSHAIVDSSQRLIALINDILDLASIEAGYLILERSSVSIPDLLTDVGGLVRERVRSAGLDLSVDCPADFGSLLCDQRRIVQALFNLLSNAIKFTPEGGRIHLTAVRAPGEVLLSVSDTGAGIPLQDQTRVFGRFERGRTKAERHVGVGLGLSLVKSLIELHGGRVELRSTSGAGTQVTCRLPDLNEALEADVETGAETGVDSASRPISEPRVKSVE